MCKVFKFFFVTYEVGWEPEGNKDAKFLNEAVALGPDTRSACTGAGAEASGPGGETGLEPTRSGWFAPIEVAVELDAAELKEEKKI